MKITVRLHRLDIGGILDNVVRKRVGIPDNWGVPTIEFDVDTGGDRFGAVLHFRAPDHDE